MTQIETLKSIIKSGFDEHSHLLKIAIEKGDEWDYQILAEAMQAFDAINILYIERYDKLQKALQKIADSTNGNNQNEAVFYFTAINALKS